MCVCVDTRGRLLQQSSESSSSCPWDFSLSLSLFSPFPLSLLCSGGNCKLHQMGSSSSFLRSSVGSHVPGHRRGRTLFGPSSNFSSLSPSLSLKTSFLRTFQGLEREHLALSGLMWPIPSAFGRGRTRKKYTHVGTMESERERGEYIQQDPIFSVCVCAHVLKHLRPRPS